MLQLFVNALTARWDYDFCFDKEKITKLLIRLNLLLRLSSVLDALSVCFIQIVGRTTSKSDHWFQMAQCIEASYEQKSLIDEKTKSTCSCSCVRSCSMLLPSSLGWTWPFSIAPAAAAMPQSCASSSLHWQQLQHTQQISMLSDIDLTMPRATIIKTQNMLWAR